ncbi:hypothetical protein GCM10027275_46150 [Rhabdobacter roseus]|uniref:Ketosteroid isomerase-like protein n=1 Tax=Rhabdobacter roseus TaxID=1655419 RepID=A0A840TUY4_9BACT|nr:nuclear transport factor 2 family protein [Rhabdobacter roseus]MBB5286715.1 ketosteroid isomerase-like protein [Rhabdobacter roseus]
MNKSWLTHLLLACLLALSAPAAAQDATASTQAFFKALLEKDGPALSSVLAGDFYLISFDAQLIDAGTLREAVMAGYVAVERGDLSGLRVRAYGEAAVVTGHWQVKGSIQGQRFDTEVVFSSLCVRQGGSWKVASLQFTPIR